MARTLDPGLDPLTQALERARLPLSAGLCAAGATVALAYLLALLAGPVLGPVGGIVLVTLGRGLGTGRSEAARLCAATAVIVGAWGVAAIRWGTLSLADLRGAQGVLGPTLTVGPAQVAWGSVAAAAGAILALSVWVSTPAWDQRRAAVWPAVTAVPASLGTVAVFWGLPLANAVWLHLLVWVGATVAVTAAAVALGMVLVRRAPVAVLLAGAAGVVAGAFLVASGV